MEKRQDEDSGGGERHRGLRSVSRGGDSGTARLVAVEQTWMRKRHCVRAW